MNVEKPRLFKPNLLWHVKTVETRNGFVTGATHILNLSNFVYGADGLFVLRVGLVVAISVTRGC